AFFSARLAKNITSCCTGRFGLGTVFEKTLKNSANPKRQ
ncbi:MAG: hypothetical protein ACI8PB_002220, partial [Desulforhopalus sp.]